MVRAGADDWQAERDIHRVVEIEKLERDEALVVVHCEYRVVSAACGIAKNRVGYTGAFEPGDAERIECFNRGLNDSLFFVAKLAFFAGVGVEPGHGDARVFDVALMEKPGGECADVDDQIHAEKLRHARERLVNGREADGQVMAGEQHAEMRDSEGIGEKFRLAGKAETYGLELVLADRCGDHGSGLADFEFECGLFQTLECGGGGLLVWLARRAGFAVANDFKFVVLRDFRRGKGLIDNFRADAGGVADGDEDAGHGQRFPCYHVLPSGNACKFQISRLAREVTREYKYLHMEPEHIRLSTPVRTSDRVVGDPPSLGRIERMAGGRLRRSRRDSSGHEGGSRRGRKHRHSSKVVRGGTLLIAFVTILVMIAIFGGWMRNRQQQSEFVEFEMLGKPQVVDRVESRFMSPSEEEARAIVARALEAKDETAVRESFHLASSTPDEVLAFLRDEEERNGPPRVDNWLGSIDPNNTLAEGVVVKRSKDDDESSAIAMLTPDQSGIWRLDFDSFAGKCQPSWESFVSGEAGEGIVRVWFSADNYFNGPFVDDEQWLCYSMARSDSDAILLGYCRKGSPQANAMEDIMERLRLKGKANATSFRGMLAISRPEGAEKRQFEIKRVLAEDWLLTEKAFDGLLDPVK